MVKLRYCARCAKWLLLAVLLVLIWGAIWMQSAVHSLNFAKPWILRSLNPADAPYTVSIDDVSIDWRNLTQLGRLRITHVNVSKRDGEVFAQLPEIYATVDPIGFLPHRSIVNTVILRAPHLFLTHSADGQYLVGFEGAQSPMPLAELIGGEDEDTSKSPRDLPFRDFVLDHAVVKFYDEKSDSRVVTNDLTLSLSRPHGHFAGKLAMPFTYEEKAGDITAALTHNRGRNDYRLDATLVNIPAKLLCSLGGCPEKLQLDGMLGGDVRLGILADGTLGAAWTHLGIQGTLTQPEWFEKPLKLGLSEAIASYDASRQVATLTDSKIVLEDTTVAAKADAHKGEDGWHIDGTGQAGALDIAKLYKYWPLFLSKDSRAWVTSKMKAGHAAGGTAKFHVTPADIAAGQLSDQSLDADVDARDVTVDYLQGFPLLAHLNGAVHFTGTTVRINGGGGTMLSGTKVNKATLWCPDLMNPKNPMEATISVDMPMTDLVQLLDLSTFTFDDDALLDAKNVRGSITSNLTLKFNAFSGVQEANPNAIHLDSVDYDIAATISNFAQNGLFGSYDVKSLSGDLKANTKATSFSGTVAVGDAGPSNVVLSMANGKPTTVDVKSAAAQDAKGIALKPANDFSLTYQTANGIPQVKVAGKRLDGSISYGKSDHSLLKDFPALKLDLALDEFVLAQNLPFTSVNGTLDCSKIRCESAHFTATQGKSQIAADITKPNGQRQLLVTASDAGAFLKGLDITDRMIGGKLELRGTYDDTKNPAPYAGHFAIHNFTLINSQILGRILSIGSLTGLANALTGSGIAFDRMVANVGERAGVVTLTEGRANGTAMGITVGGTVDTNTTKLALKGVVIPAYALNSALSNIPILGDLAGGENGLIAFNYKVGGTYTQPDVGVNPLSGLTPGILRGIFGVFDQGDKTPKTDAAPGNKVGPDVPRGNTVRRQ